jgi:glucose 1-dehydrogenase
MDFTGKTAIVTGAGKGIGLEICRKLVQAGARVVLNDVDPVLAEDAARTAAGEQGSCLAVPGDACEPAVVRKMVDGAVHLGGRLDIAIANAGITLYGDFFTYPQEDLYRVFQVNLVGTFLLAQAAANQMKVQQGGGTLLFMSSVTGHQAHRNLAAYGMSKAAIEMLAKNLVIEVSPFGINVNTLAPGATLTERTLEDANYTAIWSKITPLGRPAQVEDIAHAALFLVSDQARHITGQTLIIDGGLTSTSPNPY